MAYTSGSGIVFPMIMMRSIYSRPLVTGNTRITRISINVIGGHCSETMCPAVDSVTESWNGATATAQRQQQQQQQWLIVHCIAPSCWHSVAWCHAWMQNRCHGITLYYMLTQTPPALANCALQLCSFATSVLIADCTKRLLKDRRTLSLKVNNQNRLQTPEYKFISGHCRHREQG